MSLVGKVQELLGNRSGRGINSIVFITSAARVVLAADAPQLVGTYQPQHPVLVGT